MLRAGYWLDECECVCADVWFPVPSDVDRRCTTGLAELLRDHRIDELCISGLGLPDFVKVSGCAYVPPRFSCC